MGEDYHDGTIVPLKDDEEADEFFKKFDASRLEKLTAMSDIHFLSPDSVTENRYSSEKMQENIERQRDMYGADELSDCVAVAAVGDETLFFAPTAARYGDKWYLITPGGFVANILGIDYYHQGFICGRDIRNELTR